MSDTSTPESPLAKQLSWLLTPGAAELYERLLAAPVTIDRNLPEPAELIAKGLARVLAASGELYALPPEAALSHAMHRAATQWLRSAPDFGGLLDAIGTISLVQRADIPNVPLETSEQKQQAIDGLLTSAKNSVWALQPYPDFLPEEELADQSTWSQSYDESASRVVYRSVYDDRLLRFPEFHAMALGEIERGHQVRFASWEMPTLLSIADEAVAVYFPDRTGAGVVTKEVGLVGLLCLSFEAAWNRSVPLRSDRDLTPQHLQIHTMIALGYNNRTIGSRLDLHERTVRRRINELMDHYGQTTRHGLIRIGAQDTADTAGDDDPDDDD